MLRCFNYDIVFQEIPDEVTLALNISGCKIRCQGCHSPWLWEDIGEQMDNSLIEALIGRYRGEITCIAFMGGDSEPGSVCQAAKFVRNRYPNLKVAWYSGKENLPEKGFSLSLFDYIKLGPYIESLGGLKSPTTNQILYKVDGWVKIGNK